ncbi:NAD-dependent epimerase/dehydratase family protein [uncultured Bradyrhizobium sp.]|uniref:NAD-dependent epimerase/dehydratase family protein n=1 Tax=uncultured Bradyrhizobium sp. TaxID=199684 RepID=UPI0035CC0E7C
MSPLHGRILVTGSSGLIGRAVIERIKADTYAAAVRFDICDRDPAAHRDLRDEDAVERALADVTGIIHLGAVSRVVWAEQSPLNCWQTNVEATRRILKLALRLPRQPWFIYASSREVYGQQVELPVSEAAPLNPMNVYARSKYAAEQLVWQVRDGGLRTAVIRFSSVYGDVDDHSDRVVPAFASAAAFDGTMRLDGPDCTFDFTHVADVARGVIDLSVLLSAGERNLPPLHFVSGIGTSLRELSEMTSGAAARSRTVVKIAPPRTFDVTRFWGDPSRAAAILGWRSTIPVREGISRLVADYIAHARPAHGEAKNDHPSI